LAPQATISVALSVASNDPPATDITTNIATIIPSRRGVKNGLSAGTLSHNRAGLLDLISPK
jgi:hypothetical protein